MSTNDSETSLDDYFAAVAGRDDRSDLAVPADRRDEVRNRWPLARVYREWIAPHRESDHRSKGKPSAGTLEKERQAVARWERWDLAQRPDDFPAEREWIGLPVRHITSDYCERWLAAAVADGRLARATCESSWNHLRTLFNWLVRKSLLLEAPPRPDVSATLERHAPESDGPLAPVTWSIDELGRVYRGIDALEEPREYVEQLLAAFVVSTTCGPRTNDMFGLRWGDDVRLNGEEPHITYKAQKTKKRHWCPLPVCVVDHLRRIAPGRAACDSGQPSGGTAGEFVFPLLTGAGARRPESSRSARRTIAALKGVLRSLGYDVDDKRGDYYKPWQVGRSTAYTRLDEVSDGCGRYLCHPPHSPKVKQSADVRDNYLGWAERLRAAMLSLGHPPEFLIGLEPSTETRMAA